MVTWLFSIAKAPPFFVTILTVSGEGAGSKKKKIQEALHEPFVAWIVVWLAPLSQTMVFWDVVFLGCNKPSDANNIFLGGKKVHSVFLIDRSILLYNIHDFLILIENY